MTQYIDSLLTIVKEAGEAIMKIYNAGSIDVSYKDDRSPLTAADNAAHEIIIKGLQQMTPHIPIVSEEGNENIKSHQTATFWCVDPLDGTKEFIKKNGEFTVNIALIKGRVPVLGVVYAPALHTYYYGSNDQGSFKKIGEDVPVSISVSKRTTDLVAVGSRSHKHEEEDKLLSGLGITETVVKGSSLKFCLVAEGAADIYYRHGPTMEWDTAAGHAVVINAGGSVTGLSGEPFLYGKEVMLNPGFICKSGILKIA